MRAEVAGPDRYRAVVVLLLYYLEEVSYPEIANILRVPLGTVKTHLHRAKKSPWATSLSLTPAGADSTAPAAAVVVLVGLVAFWATRSHTRAT